MHTRDCVLTGLGRRVGVVVELEEWRLVVVGLSDSAGVALAGVVKVVIPDEGH